MVGDRTGMVLAGDMIGKIIMMTQVVMDATGTGSLIGTKDRGVETNGLVVGRCHPTRTLECLYWRLDM